MGEIGMMRALSNRHRTALAATFFVLLVWATGCRSGSPPAAMGRAEPEPPAAAGPTDERPAVEDSAIEVRSVDVREGAPETVLEIGADRPLVWTSFRDALGNVVIELPNTVQGPEVEAIEGEVGLVESVVVETDASGRRPMTRLILTTREEVEHDLRAEGDVLLVELMPLDAADAAPAAPSLAFEPIAEEEEPEMAEEPAPRPATGSSGPAELGTPEQPVRGPEPEGVRATRLRDVRVERAGDTTVVEISGDGEFAYSSFRLGEPERFVIDLLGVVNQEDRAAIPVSSPAVEAVRVAQFKPFPEPVSRVVVDLGDHPRPEIERTPDSLIVRFHAPDDFAMAGPGTGAAPAARAQAPEEPPAEPAPAPVTVEEEVDTENLDETPPEEEQDIEIVNVEPETPPAPAEAPPPAEEPPAPPRIEVEEVPSPSDAELFGTREVSLDPTPEPEEAEGPVFGARRVTGERQYFGEPIDMSLKDADVVETLRSFATISGLNIVIQPDVSGQVTVELENVPWDQALEQILKINGLGYEVEGNIMRIASLETLSREAAQQQQLEAAKALARPLQTVMKRLSYASAGDVAGLLRSGGGRGSILSQRGSVIVDDRSNTLILSELPEFMDTVLAIVDNLDEPEPQVMIEARIIETTKRFSRELGIQWGFDLEAGPATGNSTGLEFPNNLDAAGSVNLGTAGQNALVSVSMGNILDTFRLDAILNAAEEDGLVNILSTPKVATLNNQPAVIQSGVQVPIQTVANNTVTVQFVNATLRLEVLPQITADGTVVMNIDIQKREVQTAFLLPGATNAPIATKEAETQVLVRDGGTAVIGGIYEVSTDQSENRVPGLANIPIIGHLFRNHQRTDENEELLIFITPRVVRL